MAPALSWILLTYALAAVPFAVVVSTLYGGEEDVRTAGSGNPGATNVARLHGWGLGAVVMALDIGKGLLPVVVARLLWPAWDPWFGGLVALTAFLAHIFPVYLEFRGGKGVATAAGGLLGLAPLSTLAAAALWGGLLGLTGRSSVATLGAALAMVGLTAIFSPAVLPLVGGLALGIAVTHMPNVRRLWRGEEGTVVRPVRWSRAPEGGARAALEEAPGGAVAAPTAAWPDPEAVEPGPDRV
jgi:acyl phosphate:glycerol-3-phosphate acyltransferase